MLYLQTRCLHLGIDAEAAAQALYDKSSTFFWLDSSLREEGRSRFSFIGDASGPHAETIIYRSADRKLVMSRGPDRSTLNVDIFSYLDAEMARNAVRSDDLPFDFVCGYVGYLGYEMKGELGGDAPHEAHTPDAFWIFADRVCAFDHQEKTIWMICLDEMREGGGAARWFEETENALRLLSDCPAPPEIDSASAASDVRDFRWSQEPEEYRNSIREAMEHIRQGETYEVCLTNEISAMGRIRPFSLYRKLRRHNPAPYAALLRHEDMAVLCSSPELFIKISAQGTVESKPIKGTARRASDPSEDQAIVHGLRTDGKSRSENLIIVDLIRNDIGKVCRSGSVEVPALFDVETYATVHQLVSTVRGILNPGVTALDCLKAAFPGGSMTGAPKVRTLAIIDQLEKRPRGIYSGCLGYLSLNGAARMNIVIRTIVSKGSKLTIGSGGAIIALSDPEQEIQEIFLKARAQLEVLKACGADVDLTAMMEAIEGEIRDEMRYDNR